MWAARVTGKSTPPVTNRHDIVTGHLLKPLGTSHQGSLGAHADEQPTEGIIIKN